MVSANDASSSRSPETIVASRRDVLRLALAAGAAPALAGLRSAAAAPVADESAVASAHADGSQIVIGAWAEPATLLSGAPVSGAAYQQIQRIIGNGLTRLGYPSFTVEPDLAESWTVSPDGLVYTFVLQSGVKWQDGQPFTAADVKFTYDLITTKDWPGALDAYFAEIKGAVEHKAGSADEVVGVKVIDDTHIEFTFTQPDALFLASASSRQRILPKHILSALAPADIDKSDFARKPVYTGAYKVDNWSAGESITFTAFADYWEGKPAIDTIVARFLPDAATAIAELQSGGLQIGLADTDQFAAFASDPSYTTQELPGLRIVFIQYDLTKPLFSDPRVRQAISHSIDRDTVIKTVYSDKADTGDSFVPHSSWIYNANAPTYPFDLEKSKSLLAEAGWKPGGDGILVNAAGEKFSFTLTVPTISKTDGLTVVTFLQALGIEVNYKEQGAGEATGPLKVGEYDAEISAWNNYIIDPRADLQRNFQNPRPTDSTGYKNDNVDALFLKARAARSQNAEKQLYFQIEQLIETDAPLSYLWRQRDLVVVNKSLVVPTVASLAELYARIPEWKLAE
jgi:peptide/nickel transport system substrate-binding protein